MTSTRKLLENINKVHKVCNMQRAHRQHTDHNNFRQRQTTFSRPNTVICAAEMGTIVLMNAGTTVGTKGWPIEGQDR